MTKIKNCANCFWCITEEDVEEILKNFPYQKGDPDYPEAGCGVGTTEKERFERGFYCKEHSYLDGIFDTYVLKDDNYLGSGYFVISEVDGQLAKYFKIYVPKNSEDQEIRIQAYEEDLLAESEDFKFIDFTVDKLNPLYKPMENLVVALSNQAVKTASPELYGRSQLIGLTGDYETSLIISRDDYGFEKRGEEIDLSIGAHGQSRYWDAFNTFYQALEELSIKKEKKTDSQKVLEKRL